jgi:uncharacterized protein
MTATQVEQAQRLAWDRSAKRYRLAAEQGNAFAQTQLGRIYQSGEGVQRDCEEAAKWFSLAADQGSPAARFALGRMYLSGEGVPQDYVLAHMWFSLAAMNDDKEIKQVERLMTPHQVEEAQRLAREWKPEQK